MSNVKIEDLKTTLAAIQNVRSQFNSKVVEKALEIIAGRNSIPFREAHAQATVHPECQEIFQRLVALYGLIGSDAEAFLVALEETSQTSSNVVELRKAS